MGRANKKRRHPDLFYPAGIILIGLLAMVQLSGCAIYEKCLDAPVPDQIRLNRLATEYETQINAKNFSGAARTSSRIIKLMKQGEARDTVSGDTDMVLARTGRNLLKQIMTDRARTDTLADRAEKTNARLKTEAENNMALEATIKQLKQRVLTLEKEKQLLEKQLKQMKLIDLK